MELISSVLASLHIYWSSAFRVVVDQVFLREDDSGGEYISAAFRTLLPSTHFTYKAVSQRSCPHTPQQNGVAERKHRHMLETARSLLLSPSVPSQFWAEAVLTSVYFLNRIPSSVISGLSLFERRFSTPPDYEELRVYRERMWW